MNDSAKRLWAVILNWNGAAVLDDCVSSLLDSDCADLHILVVDSASTDGSIEALREARPGTDILQLDENRGFSAGCNAGIGRAVESGAEYIWLLNNDTVVARDCARQLIRFMDARPRCGLASPVIRYRGDQGTWFEGGEIDAASCETRHCSLRRFEKLSDGERYISGCAMIMRREVVNRAGLFDERFFMYSEDVEFSVRAARAGYELRMVRDASIEHRVSASTGDEPDTPTPFRAYHILQSNLLFWRSYLGFLRFHRVYCRKQLGKWVLSPLFRDADGQLSEWGRAVVDALWAHVAPRRGGTTRRAAPKWFVGFMKRRPWVFTELMSLRVPLNR